MEKELYFLFVLNIFSAILVDEQSDRLSSVSSSLHEGYLK